MLLLSELAAAVAELSDVQAELEEARRSRCEAVIGCIDSGMSQRQIASVLGIVPSGVPAILVAAQRLGLVPERQKNGKENVADTKQQDPSMADVAALQRSHDEVVALMHAETVALRKRGELVVQARESGHTLKEVAAICGTKVQAVPKIVATYGN